jgi:hypothetical protein
MELEKRKNTMQSNSEGSKQQQGTSGEGYITIHVPCFVISSNATTLIVNLPLLPEHNKGQRVPVLGLATPETLGTPWEHF